MPNIRLGCDLMVGFPDESGLDFAATKGLLTRHPFSNVHVFPYSERPGTPAIAYGGAIPPFERSARAHDITEKGADNRYEYARRFYGKTVEIVVEGEDECYGRTDEYLWCKATGNAPRKSLARVLVNKIHHDGTLDGTIR
jgi:threonylcarbamoyladenosine tRNA methylthiotransferase MtaB